MAEVAQELVVLLDEAGRAIGSAAKAGVHTRTTPLHLAFSCYVFDADDRLLVTRRSEAKRSFPGIWTNSFCGHPGPGEDIVEALRRRGRDELGLTIAETRLVLPDFRYTAAQGDVVENEICPVFTARVAPGAAVRPAPEEVAEFSWLPWPEAADAIVAPDGGWSLWSRMQVARLAALGPVPRDWPARPRDALPAAARP